MHNVYKSIISTTFVIYTLATFFMAVPYGVINGWPEVVCWLYAGSLVPISIAIFLRLWEKSEEYESILERDFLGFVGFYSTLVVLATCLILGIVDGFHLEKIMSLVILQVVISYSMLAKMFMAKNQEKDGLTRGCYELPHSFSRRFRV